MPGTALGAGEGTMTRRNRYRYFLLFPGTSEILHDKKFKKM